MKIGKDAKKGTTFLSGISIPYPNEIEIHESLCMEANKVFPACPGNDVCKKKLVNNIQQAVHSSNLVELSTAMNKNLDSWIEMYENPGADTAHMDQIQNIDDSAWYSFQNLSIRLVKEKYHLIFGYVVCFEIYEGRDQQTPEHFQRSLL